MPRRKKIEEVQSPEADPVVAQPKTKAPGNIVSASFEGIEQEPTIKAEVLSGKASVTGYRWKEGKVEVRLAANEGTEGMIRVTAAVGTAQPHSRKVPYVIAADQEISEVG